MQIGLVACRITSLKYCICEQAFKKVIQNHVRHLPIYMVIIWEALGSQWLNIYSALCYSFLHVWYIQQGILYLTNLKYWRKVMF